ncbi:MAG: hypothetical protein IT424_14015 [Pirellulales bacterium]|nr:hypothetical protein [Pirellulales bacterium]
MIRSLCGVVLVAGAAIVASATRADGILDYVPDDALGLAVVRDLAATSAKIERVAKIFQELSPQPLPAPLPLIKAATGLGAGLNDRGDALLAIMPGEEGGGEPAPLLLMAVNDYSAFAHSISADATGEICRVTIAGQEVLAAKCGDYVALMNVENRDRLEKLTSSGGQPNAALARLAEWLAKVDVAVVITPQGVDLLTAQGQAELAEQRAQLEAQLRDAQFADLVEQARLGLALTETFYGYLGARVEAAAAGIAIDGDANVRFAAQVLMADGEAAAEAPRAAQSPFAGLADEVFVVALGGPLPPGATDVAAKLARQLFQAFPAAYGFEKLTDQQWAELEQSWRDSMQGLQGLSMIMQPGTVDEPLYSNLYGVLRVADSEAYLKAYVGAVKTWNRLLEQSTSDIKLTYEIAETEVAGKQAVLTTSDVAKAAYDEHVPDVQRLMKAMFGEDGLLKVYAVAADKQTIVIAIADEQQAAAAVQQALKGDGGLANSAALQAATQLLDPAAAWQGAINLQGCAVWVERVINTFAAQFGGRQAPDLPEFPASPPVAFSVGVAEGRCSAELVWPVETLQGLAKFLKELEKAILAGA